MAESRYVKSLLGLAEEQGAVEQVHSDMQMLNKVFEENRPLVLMLKSPIIKNDKKKQVLGKLFNGKVNKLTMAILDLLTKKNREALLPGIAQGFQEAYNAYKNIGTATVTTASPIDDELRNQFKSMVKKVSPASAVNLVEKVDKDIIGGFVLNIGDKQIDASLKSKLNKLKVKLSHNPYIKEI